MFPWLTGTSVLSSSFAYLQSDFPGTHSVAGIECFPTVKAHILFQRFLSHGEQTFQIKRKGHLSHLTKRIQTTILNNLFCNYELKANSKIFIYELSKSVPNAIKNNNNHNNNHNNNDNNTNNTNNRYLGRVTPLVARTVINGGP